MNSNSYRLAISRQVCLRISSTCSSITTRRYLVGQTRWYKRTETLWLLWRYLLILPAYWKIRTRQAAGYLPGVNKNPKKYGDTQGKRVVHGNFCSAHTRKKRHVVDLLPNTIYHRRHEPRGSFVHGACCRWKFQSPALTSVRRSSVLGILFL